MSLAGLRSRCGRCATPFDGSIPSACSFSMVFKVYFLALEWPGRGGGGELGVDSTFPNAV